MHIKQKSRAILTVVGRTIGRFSYLLNLLNLRDLLGVWTKFKESIFKNKNKGDLYKSQSKIYDRAFIVKIVSR